MVASVSRTASSQPPEWGGDAPTWRAEESAWLEPRGRSERGLASCPSHTNAEPRKSSAKCARGVRRAWPKQVRCVVCGVCSVCARARAPCRMARTAELTRREPMPRLRIEWCTASIAM